MNAIVTIIEYAYWLALSHRPRCVPTNAPADLLSWVRADTRMKLS